MENDRVEGLSCCSTQVDEASQACEDDQYTEDVPTVTITAEPEGALYRQNSAGSNLARRRCVVRLDGHRYTIGLFSSSSFSNYYIEAQ